MKIAVLAGDGIGPEITAQAVRVLEVLARDGLDVQTESALVGGAAVDATGDPLPEETLRVCESARAHPVWRGGRPGLRQAAASAASGAGAPAAAQAFRPLRQPAPGHGLPGAGRGQPAEGRHRGRSGHPDHARVDGGHLLRAASGHPHQRGRRARRLRHHALQRVRDPSHRAARLRGRPPAPASAVLGGQGKCVGNDPTVA